MNQSKSAQHAQLCLMPELDLLGTTSNQAQEDRPAKHTCTLPDDVRHKLLKLRDEFVAQSSGGRFADAASKEWRQLPSTWRMVLLLKCGIGQDTDNLATLASRNWQEIPPAERELLQGEARSAKKHLGRLVALAARV